MSTNSAPTSEPANPVRLRTIDHAQWEDVQARLGASLASHALLPLLSPITLIVRDLLDRATRELQLHVFRSVLAAESGMEFEADDEGFRVLFNAEVDEHGVHNIVRACEAAGKEVIADFPLAGRSLMRMTLPYPWQDQLCRTETLIGAIGLSLACMDGDGGNIVELRADEVSKDSPAVPSVMDDLDCQRQMARIGSELGYGVMRFSPVGKVREVSRSMLALLSLDAQSVATGQLSAIIPLNFLNDIIWGVALGEHNGAFENHRIRLRLPGETAVAVLFNVSGFREKDGSILSLWQKVAVDMGATSLSEGSILGEVRVLNITRNYVPKLVEQKARDAVRLGKTELSNEERKLAILFCDIVGYTSYVEHHGASESIINTLNSILSRVAGSVGRHNGAIDKFMGDSIMALFERPGDAITAAIDMQSHSVDINQMRSRGGQQMLQMRIGIHWGDVVLGNVGTAERMDWTAIGDVVNTASRIEKNCRPGAILVSGVVRDAVNETRPGAFDFGPAFGLKVKGKAAELEVCHLILPEEPP